MTQLTDSLKSLYIKTAQKLKGSDRRQFMAEVVKGLGIGGQSLADSLHKNRKNKLDKKPRTYKKKAIKEYLKIARKRLPSRKERSEAIKKQLQYIKCNYFFSNQSFYPAQAGLLSFYVFISLSI